MARSVSSSARHLRDSLAAAVSAAGDMYCYTVASSVGNKCSGSAGRALASSITNPTPPSRLASASKSSKVKLALIIG